MHGIGLIWLLGKLIFGLKFIFYRAAVWTGSINLYRRGKRKGQKAYIALAVLVYVGSWVLVFFGSAEAWRWFVVRFKS